MIKKIKNSIIYFMFEITFFICKIILNNVIFLYNIILYLYIFKNYIIMIYLYCCAPRSMY